MLLLLLTAVVRAVVCVRTAIPGRDGTSYLWMAEQTANGAPAALCATVFHPLYPALVAILLWLWPGLDPVLAGQLVAAGAAALAVVPLWLVARALFGARAALWTGVAYAFGTWFARHPAECLSEGLFHLLVAGWAAALVVGSPRPALAGVLAALAYLTRPEGAVLGLLGAGWSWRRGERRAALLLVLTALPVAALLPLGHALWGGGFTLTPKAAFNYEVGIGAAPSALLHYAIELLRLPGNALEEIGWLWLPLALAGIARNRPFELRKPTTLLLLPFAIQCAVVPLLQSHHRFLSGFGVLLLPFAGNAMAALLPWLRARHRLLPPLLIVLVLATDGRVWAARQQDRAIERDLGHWLRPQLLPGERLATDMPRLSWFAGLQPPPPRPIPRAAILAAAAAPECRFVALVAGRSDVAAADLRALGFEQMELPPSLSDSAGQQRIRLYHRPRNR